MGSNLSRITYPCCKWSADGDGFDLVEAKFGQERLTIDVEWQIGSTLHCPKCEVLFIPK